MVLLQNAEHAFATAASDLVKVMHFVENTILPVLRTAQANEATVEAVTSLVSPSAVNVERVGFAVLGTVIKAIEDAQAAGTANGLNITLDAALVADIKAIMPAVTGKAAVVQVK